jgi:hypothetical protein
MMSFRDLEVKFGITIPNDFKLFQKLIELNNPIVEYFDSIENFSFRLTKWLAFINSDVKIDEFFEASSLEIYWRRQLEMWGSLKYLPFGSLAKPHGGQLLFNNSQGKLGKIYYTETGSKNPLYLASDLFSFVESWKIEYREDKVDTLTDLYKNWGEEFWRLKQAREST